MSLTKLTADLNIIQALDDEPNDVGGLTAAQLKAKFDQAGGTIKTYLNETLTPELDTALAGKVGTGITVNGHALSGNVTVTKGDIGLGNVDNTSDANKPVSTAQQAALDAKADKTNVLEKDGTTAFTPTADYQPATKKYVDETTSGVVLGQVPDGSITEAKLSAALDAKIESALAIVPPGGIMLWSGAASAIPTGWALCDGSNHTPDLRDRFVVGAGGAYSAGSTGGAASVTLTESQIPGHTHGVSELRTSTSGAHRHSYSGWQESIGGMEGYSASTAVTQYTSTEGDHTHTVNGTLGSTGGGQSHENRPPYYALCYIMYLGSN